MGPGMEPLGAGVCVWGGGALPGTAPTCPIRAWALRGSESWCWASSPSRARPQGCQSRCPRLSCLPPGVLLAGPPRPCPAGPHPAHTASLSPAVHVQHESQIPRHEPAAPRLQRQRPLDRRPATAPRANRPAPPPGHQPLRDARAAPPTPPFCRGPASGDEGAPSCTLTSGSTPGHTERCHGHQGPRGPPPPHPLRIRVRRALLWAGGRPCSTDPLDLRLQLSPPRRPDASGHALPSAQRLCSSVSLALSLPDHRPLLPVARASWPPPPPPASLSPSAPAAPPSPRPEDSRGRRAWLLTVVPNPPPPPAGLAPCSGSFLH